jgi:hypothetical protein
MDLKEFDALLHDAEVKMKRLKALYEQWFQGIERIEPLVARKDLERLFAILAKDKPRNTAARFRLQQLGARYSIYITLWGRIARQIEEGTYERDVRRAQGRGGVSVKPKAKAYELDLEEEIELDELETTDEIASVLSQLEAPAPAPQPKKPVLSTFSPFAMGPKRSPARGGPRDAAAPQPAPIELAKHAPPPVAPRIAQPPTPPRAPQTGKHAALDKLGPAAPLALDLDDEPRKPSPPPKPPSPPPKQPVTATFGKPKPAEPRPSPEDPSLRRLYDSYVSARRRNNESAEAVAYDKLADSVRQMQSKLRERHGDKKIDFEVVVQNVKDGIKPKIG